MLAGSGGTVAAHCTPSLIVIGAAAGIVCGILAMIGPGVQDSIEKLCALAGVILLIPGHVDGLCCGTMKRNIHGSSSGRDCRRAARTATSSRSSPTS